MTLSADMTETPPNNPLHGVTIEMILNRLVEHYGWEVMARMILIRCFSNDPVSGPASNF